MDRLSQPQVGLLASQDRLERHIQPVMARSNAGAAAVAAAVLTPQLLALAVLVDFQGAAAVAAAHRRTARRLAQAAMAALATPL
jgi:hypothetical protein